MARKTVNPGAGSAKSRALWRPYNALTVGAATRASWAKTAGKGSRDPRGRKPKRRT